MRLRLAFALLLAASPLSAQTARWSLPHFGQDAVAIGDLDGDGASELATTRKGVTYLYFSPGSAAIVSPRDGRVLFLLDQTTTPAIKVAAPEADACGDVDDDGTPDFAFTADDGVRVFSGASFGVISAPPGIASALGDANGDGHDDLVVVATPEEVRLVSGADGSTLLSIAVTGATSEFDVPVFEARAAGDVDGDGIVDVVVRGRVTLPDGTPTAYVRLYSGADGALLAENANVQWGYVAQHSLAPAGDLDGDGHPDLFALVPFGTPADVDAELLSGSDLALLRAYATPSVALAQALVVPGDVDRDGVPDLAVGGRSPPGSAHAPVAVFSGADATVVATWNAGLADAGAIVGSLAAPGDLDGDGWPDLVVGLVPNQGKDPDSGPLRAFSLGDKPIADLGGNQVPIVTWPGGAVEPVLTATGSLATNTALKVRVVNAPAGPAWLFAGTTLVATTGEVSPDIALPLATDVTGVAAIAVRWPAAATGLTIFVQARWLDGFTRSNVVALTGP